MDTPILITRNRDVLDLQRQADCGAVFLKKNDRSMFFLAAAKVGGHTC